MARTKERETMSNWIGLLGILVFVYGAAHILYLLNKQTTVLVQIRDSINRQVTADGLPATRY